MLGGATKDGLDKREVTRKLKRDELKYKNTRKRLPGIYVSSSAAALIVFEARARTA